jgi:hypothetical protein
MRWSQLRLRDGFILAVEAVLHVLVRKNEQVVLASASYSGDGEGIVPRKRYSCFPVAALVFSRAG